MVSRTGAFEIILIFICLNLGCFILDAFDFVDYSVEAIETPDSINDRFVTSIGGSIAIIAAGSLTGLLIGALVQGAALALVIAVLSQLVPILDWIFLGFPKLLNLLGVPSVITISIGVLIGVVWVWFLIGIVGQRYME